MGLQTTRILIDGYFIAAPYGFGRYVVELCRALSACPRELDVTVAVPSDVDTAALPVLSGIEWRTATRVPFPIWEQVTVPRLARELGCDVVHFPSNTSALFTWGIPTVVTVHDTIFLRQRYPLTAWRQGVSAAYVRWSFRSCTLRARELVSISRTTQQSLVGLGRASSVVYNTIDGFLGQLAVTSSRVEGQPYFLHRGGLAPHKNTSRVIDAFRRVHAEHPTIQLKVLGVPGGASHWHAESEPHIQFLPRVSDAELAALYAGCSGVVVPSLEEGFGLTIIEGFGFAAPVITSDLDPMREVAGGAAHLVDPHDVEALADALRRLVEDRVRVREMVARGARRVQDFSAEAAAAGVAEVYLRAAGRRRAGDAENGG